MTKAKSNTKQNEKQNIPAPAETPVKTVNLRDALTAYLATGFETPERETARAAYYNAFQSQLETAKRLTSETRKTALSIVNRNPAELEPVYNGALEGFDTAAGKLFGLATFVRDYADYSAPTRDNVQAEPVQAEPAQAQPTVTREDARNRYILENSKGTFAKATKVTEAILGDIVDGVSVPSLARRYQAHGLQKITAFFSEENALYVSFSHDVPSVSKSIKGFSTRTYFYRVSLTAKDAGKNEAGHTRTVYAYDSQTQITRHEFEFERITPGTPKLLADIARLENAGKTLSAKLASAKRVILETLGVESVDEALARAKGALDTLHAQHGAKGKK